MEIGIPQSLWTPDSGEVVFNVLTGDATGKSIAGLGGPVYPVGLPDGNGYHVAGLTGVDGAGVRNPFHARPHSHGGIVHRFRRQSKIMAFEVIIDATTPEHRQTMTDWLRNALLDILSPGIFGTPQEKFGRYFWTPAANPLDLGNTRYKPRYHKVHLFSPLDVVSLAASEGQSPQGIAGPKTATWELISEHPEALTWAQDITDIGGFDSGFIPNDGNTETWPVVRVYTAGPFTLFGPGPSGEPSGRSMRWGYGPDPSQNPPPILGTYIELDMHRQTAYWDGNGANALAGFDMSNTDFFSITPGGGTVSATGSASSVKVFSNSAWVG